VLRPESPTGNLREWDSADGHLRGFRGSPQFAGFFAAVRPYVDRIEEMRHYEVKSAGPS
jgi:hypothetical protein